MGPMRLQVFKDLAYITPIYVMDMLRHPRLRSAEARHLGNKSVVCIRTASASFCLVDKDDVPIELRTISEGDEVFIGPDPFNPGAFDPVVATDLAETLNSICAQYPPAEPRS